MTFYNQLSQKLLEFQIPKTPPPCDSPHAELWEKVIRVVPREEWGALPPRTDSEKLRPLPWPHPCVLWTFAQSEECRSVEECGRVLRALQRRHMDMGMLDIQYNFYVGGDLNIYEGRGWNTYSGCLYPGFNPLEEMHVGLAYLGKYANQNYPNQEVLEARKSFVRYGMENDFIDFEYNNLCLTSNLDQYT